MKRGIEKQLKRLDKGNVYHHQKLRQSIKAGQDELMFELRPANIKPSPKLSQQKDDKGNITSIRQQKKQRRGKG